MATKEDFEIEKLKTEIRDIKSNFKLQLVKYLTTLVGAIVVFWLINRPESILKRDISMNEKKREEVKLWLQYVADADSIKLNRALMILTTGMSAPDDSTTNYISLKIDKERLKNSNRAAEVGLDYRDTIIRKLKDSLLLYSKNKNGYKNPIKSLPSYDSKTNIISLNSNNDQMGVPGNIFDGYRTAYMTRKPEVNGMWTADGGGPFHVGWIFPVSVSGKYRLKVLYASVQSRPMDIMVNDIRVKVGLDSITTSNVSPKWFDEGIIELTKGNNRLWFHSNALPPNIDAVKLIKE